MVLSSSKSLFATSVSDSDATEEVVLERKRQGIREEKLRDRGREGEEDVGFRQVDRHD